MLDLILNRKTASDILYEAAMEAVNRVTKKFMVRTEKGIETFEIQSDVFSPIIPGDQNSPKVMGLSEDNLLIYYPKFSTPYAHNFVDKCKFATVLSGCIYDEITGRRFSSERFNDGSPHCLKIRPTDNFRPYTKACECYVFVHVDDCNKTLEQLCP